MIAELRLYTITPGHTEALFDQFRDVSLPLFAEHGITAHGPWLRTLAKGEQLVYVIEFDDEADRTRKWSAFRADPRWVAVQDAAKGQIPHIAAGETLELAR
ncbi:MAG: NIPSNAP family protein [Kibdelosporangium sp.]